MIFKIQSQTRKICVPDVDDRIASHEIITVCDMLLTSIIKLLQMSKTIKSSSRNCLVAEIILMSIYTQYQSCAALRFTASLSLSTGWTGPSLPVPGLSLLRNLARSPLPSGHTLSISPALLTSSSSDHDAISFRHIMTRSRV